MANVCETCGDEGWVEALVFCDSCKVAAVHRYCCGITPVPIDGYVTWFCSDCDESDSASDSIQVELEDNSNLEVSSSPPLPMDETGTTSDIPGSPKSNEKKKKTKKKRKKKRKIISQSVPDATVVETTEVSTKKQDDSETAKSDELRNESSVLEKSGKKKKKTDKGEEKQNEESSNNFSPVQEAESLGLQATTSVEPMKESKKRKCSESKESEELNVLAGNQVSAKKQDGSENGKSDELNGSDKSGTKKKKKKRDRGEEKKNEESSKHFSSVPEAEGHELQATTTSVEPMKESKKRKCSESKESEELNVLAGNQESVLEKSAKKKMNEESSGHTLPVLDAHDHVLQDVTSVEAMKESTTPLNVLVGNEASVVEKSAKKKKKKKSSEESSTHTSPVLKALDCGHQDTTSVEAIKESTMPLNVLAGNEVSIVEKKMKKKKKKKSSEESSNHTSPVLKAVDCGHQDTTSVEAMKESKKHKTSVSRDSDELNRSVRNAISDLEKSEKKKEKRNEESSNHTAPVLAAKDNVAHDTNVEPEKAQESSASRKPHELAGLETNGASVSEGGNSTNVPDHTSCTTSKKRKLSSDNMQVTSVNMELPANNSSCKEAESNMPQTNELIPALNNGRAQPIWPPKWRGSVTVKQGNVCSIHGLVAHLSTLASPQVHEKARLLPTRLSAEMFPRLEIWPPSFLKNGPPKDESIALYFFPSADSNGEKVYYSLVDEMKKKDLAMRCLLDDVELLLFTSYQLPLPLWMFRSKEYLWGIFRRGKTSRL